MTEDVGVQRAALHPFGQRAVRQLLSTSDTLGEPTLADRPGYAQRQGPGSHLFKIRAWKQ